MTETTAAASTETETDSVLAMYQDHYDQLLASIENANAAMTSKSASDSDSALEFGHLAKTMMKEAEQVKRKLDFLKSGGDLLNYQSKPKFICCVLDTYNLSGASTSNDWGNMTQQEHNYNLLTALAGLEESYGNGNEIIGDRKYLRFLKSPQITTPKFASQCMANYLRFHRPKSSSSYTSFTARAFAITAIKNPTDSIITANVSQYASSANSLSANMINAFIPTEDEDGYGFMPLTSYTGNSHQLRSADMYFPPNATTILVYGAGAYYRTESYQYDFTVYQNIEGLEALTDNGLEFDAQVFENLSPDSPPMTTFTDIWNHTA